MYIDSIQAIPAYQTIEMKQQEEQELSALGWCDNFCEVL
jgi:hypothetical protein